MSEMEITASDVKESEALAKALSGPRLEGVDVCAAWKIVKPFWSWIIAIARRIPKIGETLAKALELIGGALDTFCPKII